MVLSVTVEEPRSDDAAARSVRGSRTLQLLSEEVADFGAADFAVLCPRKIIHDRDDDPNLVDSP